VVSGAYDESHASDAGGYKTDRDFLWKGYYGNIESVRTLIMLNSIVDKLPEHSKLGTQHILSYQGLG
jgi:hypothetical protein